MSEEFGSDYITIVDDDGTEFELEVLDTMDYKDQTFVAFLPADMDEDDPDYELFMFSGLCFLSVFLPLLFSLFIKLQAPPYRGELSGSKAHTYLLLYTEL